MGSRLIARKIDVVECISLAIFRYTILCAYYADYYAHQASI
jgi:hypothetical protein